MNISLYWAVRILKNRKSHMAIKKHMRSALFGITFSVIPLVIAVILANGMIDGITSRMIHVDSGHMKLYQLEEHSEKELAALQQTLQKNHDITVQPMIEGDGILFSEGRNQIVRVRGVDSESYGFTYIDLIEGTFELKNKTIIISDMLSDHLEAGLNDKITLLTFGRNSRGEFTYKPSFYTITGICSSGYHMIDESLVFVDYGSSAPLFNTAQSKVMKIVSADSDISQFPAAEVKQAVEKADPYGWYSMTWDMQYAGLYRNYRTTKILLYIIMGLIIITAGINISSCSAVIIRENTANIGMLKAMGAPVRKIRAVFFIASSIIGIIGSTAGVLIGMAAGSQLNNIFSLLTSCDIRAFDFYMTSIEFSLPLLEITSVFLYGIVVSLLSAFVPTRYISRCSPIQMISDS